MSYKNNKAKIKKFLIRIKIINIISYVLLPIIKFIKKISFRLSLMENAASCRKNTSSNKSIFLSEAKIFNMQKDPKKITVGQGSVIRGELLIHPYGGKIHIGDNCFVGEGCRIWSGESIDIGNNVMIGHNVNLIDFSHKTNSIERAEEYRSLVADGHPSKKGNIPTRPIVVEDNVIIYAGASIIMGVTIGKASVVSAGSVVIKDVPPYSLVLGNPAKIIWRTN
jgi:acetyltransferase-like isoleucine patch superfamily enzyme